MKKIFFYFSVITAVFLPGFSTAQTDSGSAPFLTDTIMPPLRIIKEPRFLLNIHSGYSYGLGSTFRFYPDDIRSIRITKIENASPQTSVSYRNPWKGLGDGVRFGGGLSYIWNDFINIGLDVDWFESTISKTRDSSYNESQRTPLMGAPNQYNYKEVKTISYNATLITFTPHITFKAISRPKWFMYNKIGAVVTYRPNSLQEETTDITIRQGWQGFFKDSTSRVIRNYDWNIKNPAWGFMGAFGIQFKIAGRLRAFGEAQFSHIVFVAEKRVLLDYIVNGQDLTNTLPLSLREVKFVKAFVSGSSNNSANEPAVALVQRIPISYVGGQIGIAFQIR